MTLPEGHARVGEDLQHYETIHGAMTTAPIRRVINLPFPCSHVTVVQAKWTSNDVALPWSSYQAMSDLVPSRGLCFLSHSETALLEEAETTVNKAGVPGNPTVNPPTDDVVAYPATSYAIGHPVNVATPRTRHDLRPFLAAGRHEFTFWVIDLVDSLLEAGKLCLFLCFTP